MAGEKSFEYEIALGALVPIAVNENNADCDAFRAQLKRLGERFRVTIITMLVSHRTAVDGLCEELLPHNEATGQQSSAKQGYANWLGDDCGSGRFNK